MNLNPQTARFSAHAANLNAIIESKANTRTALEKDALFIRYQPIVCSSTLKMHGVKAFVRWEES